MSESSHSESLPRTDNPEVRHEARDINVRLILWTATILVIGAVVIHVALYGLLVVFKATATKPADNPLAVEESNRPLDERIQEMHEAHLEGLQHFESPNEFAMPGKPEQTLSRFQHAGNLEPYRVPEVQTYGKAEPPDPGFVRVPIEQAIDMVLQTDRKQRVLPASPQAREAPPRTGLDRPNTANSGHGPGGPPR
jgi:hypothetical protein